MILSIAHTKGGVGKTTIAVQLATYLIAKKKIKDVLLIDADPQHSALNAITRRNEENNLPLLECDNLTEAKALQTQLKIKAPKFKHVIIDLGARNTDTLRAALMFSNAVLVPFQPLSFSLEAFSDEFTDILHEAQSYGAEFQTYGFINFAEVQGSANQDAQEYIEQLDDIQFLDSKIVKRKAITAASTFGKSVFEDKPIDQKACAEIEALAKKFFN